MAPEDDCLLPVLLFCCSAVLLFCCSAVLPFCRFWNETMNAWHCYRRPSALTLSPHFPVLARNFSKSWQVQLDGNRWVWARPRIHLMTSACSSLTFLPYAMQSWRADSPSTNHPPYVPWWLLVCDAQAHEAWQQSTIGVRGSLS